MATLALAQTSCHLILQHITRHVPLRALALRFDTTSNKKAFQFDCAVRLCELHRLITAAAAAAA